MKTDFSLTLRIALLNGTEEHLVHTFAQLRFVCKTFWNEELAEHACLLIPFKRQTTLSESKPSFVLFDTLYRYVYAFSLNYRNYCCPTICGETLTSICLLGELDKEVTQNQGIECIQLTLSDGTILKMRIRSFDEKNKVFCNSQRIMIGGVFTR